MNNYQMDEQWSFSWVVPVFSYIGKVFCVGLTGLCAAIYIVGVALIQATKETFSA